MKGGLCMKRKPIYLLGLVVALLLIMACSLTGSGSGEEPVSTEEPTPSEAGGGDEPVITDEAPAASESDLCANEYYPVSDGATWSYYGTSTTTEDFSFTNTITSTRSDGFTVTVDFDNVTLTQEWACTVDGILALEIGGGNAGTLRADNVNLVMDTQNASGITYPNEILPGDTWTHTLDFIGTMDISGEPAEANGDTQSTYTAIGIESVTVPAGTFDAMKIETTNTININSTFQGTTVPVTFTGTTTTWLAPGVGWVKSVSSSEFSGIASSETVELQSYSIP